MTRSGGSFSTLSDIYLAAQTAELSFCHQLKNGGSYVVDNLCDSDSAVALGNGNCLYDGRPDPYTARNCYHSGAGTRHPRAEGPLAG